MQVDHLSNMCLHVKQCNIYLKTVIFIFKKTLITKTSNKQQNKTQKEVSLKQGNKTLKKKKKKDRYQH